MVSVSHHQPLLQPHHQGMGRQSTAFNRWILLTLLFIAVLNLYETKSSSMNKAMEYLAMRASVSEATVPPCPVLEEKKVVVAPVPVVADVVVPVPTPTLPTTTDFAKSSWCPKAKCENSVRCIPCSRRFLIVVASGRSASTTLTWMLNTLPGVRMSGENNNLLTQLQKVYANTFDHPKFEESAEIFNSWGHNTIPAQSTSCIAQSWVEGMNPVQTEAEYKEDSDTILGFKTIRFVEGVKDEQVEEMVKFVTEHFPCARFIVNYRSDAKAQAESYSKSWMSATGKARSEEWVQNTNEKLINLANLLGKDRAVLIDSSEWTKDVTILNNATKWLGFRDCEFKELMEFNIDRYRSGRTEVDLPKNCQYKD